MAQGRGERERAPQRRFLVVWLLLLALLIAAFAGVVAILNATVYSASGFVSSYLDALGRHDAAAALATPGVVRARHGSGDLLTPAALADLSDIRLISDTTVGGSTPGGSGKAHRLVFEYRIAQSKGSSTFLVKPTGVRFGFFSTWAFERSPIALLQVTPRHAAGFTANGVELSAKGPGEAALYQALTPGAVVLSHTSPYLTATPRVAVLTQPGATVTAEVDVRANRTFVTELQKQLDAQLTRCTSQKVLLPTGCPFGQRMDNRIEGTPDWSMATFPPVKIIPGTEPGTWQVPPAVGAAHLKVKVRSLFDGTLSTFDSDVPFTVRYLISFAPNGVPTITPVA